MKLTRRVLHNRARPVDFRFPLRNEEMARSMLKFMRSQDGIGLAAPQIGVSRRLFVMEIDGRQWQCFNPEITAMSESMAEITEGCLSFPGESCTIKRPASIQVRYQDATGVWQQEQLEGIPARCFQHEFDHLEGIIMQHRYKEQNAE